MTRKLREAIRKHIGAERVRILTHYGKQGRHVHAYGSDNPTDRSKDRWSYAGTLAELLAEVERDA